MKLADFLIVMFAVMFIIMALVSFYRADENKPIKTSPAEKVSVVTNKTYAPTVNLGISGGWD